MVDALRYELGVALEKLLADDGPVELEAAYAQLPTITLVGMASLLPAWLLRGLHDLADGFFPVDRGEHVERHLGDRRERTRGHQVDRGRRPRS